MNKMMKAIGHMREKKEGGKEDNTPRERDTRESGKWHKNLEKKRCNNEKFRHAGLAWGVGVPMIPMMISRSSHLADYC